MLGNNRPIIYLPELAYSYARIGRRNEAERYFAEIEALDNPAGFGAGGMAAAYLAIGDETRALEQLERGFELGESPVFRGLAAELYRDSGNLDSAIWHASRGAMAGNMKCRKLLAELQGTGHQD